MSHPKLKQIKLQVKIYKNNWLWNYVEKRMWRLRLWAGEIARFQGIYFDYGVAKADICISPRLVTSLLRGR